MHLPRGLVYGIQLTSLLRRKIVSDIFVGGVVNFLTHALMNKNVLYPQRDCIMKIKYQGPAEYIMKTAPSSVIPSGVASIQMHSVYFRVWHHWLCYILGRFGPMFESWLRCLTGNEKYLYIHSYTMIVKKQPLYKTLW